ncbi:MAG TPA: aminoglycoside phosphotransferase family protein [Acidimicrobiia bacterium]|jgi:hypothetical protein|nr:aminoglycoside phosphotransferase family protein [Acidimicrobiia bacterium]
MPDTASQQLIRVLAVLPEIEKRSDALSPGSERPLEVTGRQALDPLAPQPASGIPTETSGKHVSNPTGEIRSTTSASLVRLGKFSTMRRIRAAAFYWTAEVPVVVRIALGLPREPILSKRVQHARAAIGGRDLLEAPEILDRGWSPGFSYLVEELVFGEHPLTPPEKSRAGAELIHRLFAALERADLRYVTEKTHPATRKRLARLLERFDPAPKMDPRKLMDATARLVDGDHLLPTGWSHGDLVFSNVIRRPDGGLSVIDWENADDRPVIADLAKLGAAMPGTEGIEMITGLGPGSLLEEGRSSLGTRDQLVRYYLQELSWWEPKFERARKTNRMATFNSWVGRRLELLAALSDR